MTYILGISAFYHDSAATLLEDGRIVCAFSQERFSRIKQDAAFPHLAIAQCLQFAGIRIEQIALVAFYEDPELKYDRIMATYKAQLPGSALRLAANLPRFLKNRDMQKKLKQEFRQHFQWQPADIFFSEHHLSHAASAFYPSGFQEAAVLCVDGVGEWATVSAWHGKGTQLRPLWQINFPHSLGLLYSAFTYYCGFKVDSGEYKLMGLAPYGTPVYSDLILTHLIQLEADGHFQLDMQYFDYETGDCMISEKFCQLFGGPARKAESELTQKEMDLAASIQQVTEQVMLGLLQRLKRSIDLPALCMSGGVALNCVANGKLLRSGVFAQMFVQPAAGDAGGSLGAALVAWYQTSGQSRLLPTDDDAMQGSYLGNSYSDEAAIEQLASFGAVYQHLSESQLLSEVAALLAAGKVVGWHQGRMEFGPRALGARSILGHPAAPDMQSTLNLKIKNRESFRPFAPAVLAEHCAQWFDLHCASPYMLLVAKVRPEHCVTAESAAVPNGLARLKQARSAIQAVTHVDYTARIQTVDGKHNGRFQQLLQHFYQLTGIPILINTSFNVRGEPIVESPADAYRCFMRTEMDALAIGDLLFIKSQQPPFLESTDWRHQYALD